MLETRLFGGRVGSVSVTLLAAVMFTVVAVRPAWSQSRFAPPRRVVRPGAANVVNLSGPRFGVTVLSPGNVDALAERGIFLSRPLVTQFGWQFEKQLYTSPEGLTALTEFVPLVSGLEQGVALPSLNWLVGIRTPIGTEFGVGPNITPAGVGLVAAVGVTVRSGAINIPFNFAVATSKYGARVSIMTGFNLRQ